MRIIILLSWACIAASFFLAYWAWAHLPVLDSYPVHWNANGVADRYGSKAEVLFALSIMPITSTIIFLIFYFVPKIEPIRASVEPNTRPYIFLWGMMMVLFTGIQYFIFKSYSGLEHGTTNAQISIPLLTAGISLFYILLGNIFGKIRQNFLFGIRTPWTLSSDISWEKTHRITGRMFVFAGLIGLIGTFFLKPETALLALIGLSLAVTVIAVIYSFVIWKSDPNKRQ